MSKTTTESNDTTSLICGLKAAVTALECQHKMELEKKKMMEKTQHQDPKLPPMYMMIPIEKENSHDSKMNKQKNKDKCEIKSISSCDSRKNIKEKEEVEKKRRKKPSKGEDKCAFVIPEMRGGVLYTKCECLSRNGLQDDCPLTLCQGQLNCLIKPWPECPPGKYFRARHPEIYTTPSNPNALTS